LCSPPCCLWLRIALTTSSPCRYNDDHNEYRHVQLPKQMLKAIPKDYFDGARGTLKLLWEDEWRGLGITQSLGWEHYEVHEPEPHILLFK
jgi:cyclin-dependent kinase regulatory subunit CKS1